MNRTLTFITAFLLFISCKAQDIDNLIQKQEVERIVRTLAADEMQGRAAFTPGAEKAASFIEKEFQRIGLQPLKGEEDFRQNFFKTFVKQERAALIINGKTIGSADFLVISDQEKVNWNSPEDAEISIISAGDNFFGRCREIISQDKDQLVLVDASFKESFAKLRDHYSGGRVKREASAGTIVFVLGLEKPKTFKLNLSNRIDKKPLFNIAGIIPGKSKPDELVIFSGHYDHIGILEPVKGDSIANGADDDASGVTAVIALADYFKKLNNNERTLVFATFTAEELGGYGSRYFSEKLNPDDVMTMFNIEMIGKVSKFGRNAAFITGFEKSDFGNILQQNLEGTKFRFHPDPYPEQNLFYRSDNATLAALGVPAHTISTVQIDKDKFYHTVDDEFETLDVDNITSTIKAIAISAESIISGKDTPRRIPKLEN